MNNTKTHEIKRWIKPIAEIPPGYFLCDGNNGTPDLRDRFISESSEKQANSTANNPDSKPPYKSIAYITQP